MQKQDQLPQERISELFKILRKRFEKHMDRHPGLSWPEIQTKLESQPQKLWTLNEMEETGGEPDVVAFEEETGSYLFFDCSEESPKGRRSLCYDLKAWESRKEHKPKNSAIELATEMGIEMLTEEQYFQLQQLGNFDNKTSSWVLTPDDIRGKGGAIFGDYRFGRVFIYHNGAESYYAARGFRGSLKV